MLNVCLFSSAVKQRLTSLIKHDKKNLSWRNVEKKNNLTHPIRLMKNTASELDKGISETVKKY